jgi:hypothetical protein
LAAQLNEEFAGSPALAATVIEGRTLLAEREAAYQRSGQSWRSDLSCSCPEPAEGMSTSDP